MLQLQYQQYYSLALANLPNNLVIIHACMCIIHERHVYNSIIMHNYYSLSSFNLVAADALTHARALANAPPPPQRQPDAVMEAQPMQH